MEVEFTARQMRVSKALRVQAEEGLQRIARILGKTARASVTFSVQKKLQIAEVTIQARLQTIAATGKAYTLETALRQALEHAENQARRHRDRRIESKRLPKEEKVLTAPPVPGPRPAPLSRSQAPKRGRPIMAPRPSRGLPSPSIPSPPARSWLNRTLSGALKRSP
jgi:putative sigma-54 modulation protein